MRILIDTNVLLDVALDREEFVEDSQAVLDWCSTKGEQTWVSWHTITNCYYILRRSPPKGVGDDAARQFLSELLDWAKIAPTSTQIAKAALEISGGDLEDHLQGYCADAISADVILTRNVKDFKASPVRALTPTEFLTELPAE